MDTGLNEISRADLTGIDAATHDLFFCDDQIETMTLAERIFKFEELALKGEQVDVPMSHELIDGLYRRCIRVPEGSAITGVVHDKDHMDAMVSGKMLVPTENGCQLIEAPLFLTSRAGCKKAAFAIEETIWVSYYPTNAETVEDAEKEFMANDYKGLTAKYYISEVA